METELLREYLVIADELNFTHAAQKLHTTQSTLSKHVAALEREFGETLFRRSRRGIELTEAGAVLYRRGAAVIDMVDGTRAEIAALKQNLSVKVAGLLQNSDVLGLISRVARTLRVEGSGTLALLPTSAPPATALVLAGEADAVICHRNYAAEEDPSLRCIELYRERLLAFVEAGHPLASRSELRIDDLREASLARLSGAYADYGWTNIRHICVDHGFDPRGVPLPIDNMVDLMTYPLDDLVLLLQRGVVPLETFSGDHRSCLPVVDDDAVFVVCAYCRVEDEERLRPFLDVLQREAAHMGIEGDSAHDGTRGRFRSRCDALAREVSLNESEEAAMQGFARGRSIDRIASDLGLSRVMVGDLLASVYKKTGVRDRQGLLDRIEAKELPW
ncbi:LysR family transcriptional regulator [uncultured Adlercreutzia sp.]|uniref:LysR family transcriptional regulator n=1 Tax=uncultured Adlercreutzia sp. TaxID=875803 RepID=UPI0026F39470|nr:LysR family transcriptional regulator [uncultured Adlercreutzia sp.]